MNTQEDLVEVINSALESWHAANTPEACFALADAINEAREMGAGSQE